MSEATQTVENNDALIEEMLRDAKAAPAPDIGDPIIHRGDGELPAPMTVKEVSGAGYVYVWDTRTFEKIPILYYMLPSKLRTRREDGSFRFTTNDPKQLPKRGTLKCWLHSEGPDRTHYNDMGFITCRKSNLTNPYQVQQHMKKKHPQEFAAIEEERKQREREEDRNVQRVLAGLPKLRSEEGKAPVVTELPEELLEQIEDRVARRINKKVKES